MEADRRRSTLDCDCAWDPNAAPGDHRGGLALYFNVIGSPIADANAKISMLEIGEKRFLDQTLPEVYRRMGLLSDRVEALEAQRRGLDTWSYLYTEDNGFSVVDTSTGKFLVSRVKQEAVGDGYRMTFRIGNVQASTYLNAKLEVSWGERYDPAKHGTPRQWETSRASVTTSADRLSPAAWTNVTVVLAPASLAELGALGIKLEAPGASLTRQP